MSRVAPPGNQRQSFRCTVSDGRTACSLKVGRETLPARLLDESAGGFAVQVERLAGLQAGDTATLLTDAGWFSVRVVHIAEQGVESETSYRLGLLRLSDATPYETPRASVWAGTLRVRLSQWAPHNGTMVLFALLLTFGVVLVAIYMTQSNVHVSILNKVPKTSPESGHWITLLPSGLFSTKSHSSPSHALDDPDAGSPFAGASPFEHGTVPRQGAKSSGSASELMLHDSIRWMAGATAMMMPEVIERLQLTEQQQTQIQRLIDQTVDAIRQMERQSVGKPRSERAQLRSALLEQSRQDALKLLTDPQRAQWNQLIAVPKKPD